jgi:streptogramin lyase
MTEQSNRYGPTAARTHGRPGRETRPATTTIDMHNHVWSAEAAAFVAPHFDPAKVSLTRLATDATRELMRKQLTSPGFRQFRHAYSMFLCGKKVLQAAA